MTHPEGTAYEIKLHSESEEQWLSRVDQAAYLTLRRLLDGEDISILDLDQRSSWARFIMSLVRRNPEKVASIAHIVDAHIQERLVHVKRNYDAIKQARDPATFAEYEACRAPVIREELRQDVLVKMVDSERVGAAINQMISGVATLVGLKPRFLTSDRPVVMTNGIAYPTSYILLPISPRSLFIATNTSWQLAHLRAALREGTLIDHINNAVAAQARKLVFFCDDSQTEFIEARLYGVPGSTDAQT